MSTPKDTGTVIRSRTGEVLHTSQKATIREALEEAVAASANLSGSNLRGSNLRGSNLRYSNLRGSDLRGSDLRGSDLRGSDLSGSDLRGSDLSGSDLRGSDLSGSDLSGSDLRGSDLSGSDLRGSDLSGSDLRGSDLSGSDLSGSDLRYSNLNYSELRGSNLSGTTCLSVTGLPSGHAILAPLPEGWRLTIGCWTGTVPELRELIAKDTGWPEASGEQIAARRPMLTALADMCNAWAAANEVVLQQIQDQWAKAEVPA